MELLPLLGIGLIYFIPSVAALSRGHPKAGAIIALNILLGWTVLGWIGALIWVLTYTPEKTPKA